MFPLHNIIIVFILMSQCYIPHVAIVSSVPVFTMSKRNVQIHPFISLRVNQPKSGELGVMITNNLLTACRESGESIDLSYNSLEHKVIIQRSDAMPTGTTQFNATYHGIFGIYPLPLGHYVAFIKDASPAKVDHLMGQIRVIRSLDFVRIPSTISVEGDAKCNETAIALQMEMEALLQSTFARHSFYFSSDGMYDVTRTFQHNLLRNRTSDRVHWTECDDRFFWNLNSAAPLVAAGDCAASFVTPVTNAWMSSKDVKFCGGDFSLCLVSRRSRLRQGPRFIKRGSDVRGNVANFVETEQIVQSAQKSTGSTQQGVSKVSSFVQVRGSIPLLWRQKNTWQLAPTITMCTDLLRIQCLVLQSHLRNLFATYCEQKVGGVDSPRIVLLNLIDRKGTQGRLGDWLQAALAQLKDSTKLGKRITDSGELPTVPAERTRDRGELEVADVFCPAASRAELRQPALALRHVWFDYHYKCRGDSDNVSALKELHPLLRDVISNDDKGAFFVGRRDESRDSVEVDSLQTRVVRTNCIDCLDRTNVVQTMVSRWVLIKQFKALMEPAAAPGDKLESVAAAADGETRDISGDAEDCLALSDKAVESVLRHLWADNGDYLSMLYAGSRAMKRDVTRSGRRTRFGALDDAVASVRRYYVNNYKDEAYQLGLDLMLGTVDCYGRRPWVTVDRGLAENKRVGQLAKEKMKSAISPRSVSDVSELKRKLQLGNRGGTE